MRLIGLTARFIDIRSPIQLSEMPGQREVARKTAPFFCGTWA
jgi:hypothetical protein